MSQIAPMPVISGFDICLSTQSASSGGSGQHRATAEILTRFVCGGAGGTVEADCGSGGLVASYTVPRRCVGNEGFQTRTVQEAVATAFSHTLHWTATGVSTQPTVKNQSYMAVYGQ